MFENSIPSSCGEEDLGSETYRASVNDVLYETCKTKLSAQSQKEVYYVYVHECLYSFTISIRYRGICNIIMDIYNNYILYIYIIYIYIYIYIYTVETHAYSIMLN